MSRFAAVILAVIAALGGGYLASAAPAVADGVKLALPQKAGPDETFAFEIRLPARAAAADGRIYLGTNDAEVIGIAPLGGGKALAPVAIPGGAAFGAYGLTARHGRTSLRVVVAATTDVQLRFRVVIDTLADAAGKRFSVQERKALASLRVGRGGGHNFSPRDANPLKPMRDARPLVPVVNDGVTDVKDLDVVIASWTAARTNGATCGDQRFASGDANGDGCVDVADIAVVMANRTIAAGTIGPATASLEEPLMPAAAAAAAPGLTFTVNSTADTTDVNKGDGLCADAVGACTLRAAIIESNWQLGDNRIEFNLPGPAPVRIQQSSTTMPLIQDRTGTLVIDGYSQPGSSVNTATIGSNAVPGIELRGTGDSPRNYGLFITSPGNVVRGLLFDNQYRALFIDGVDAHDNLIVGNFFGYTTTGGADPYLNAYTAVALNTGAHHNLVGTPSLADRNFMGRARKGVYLYGPGTNDNTIQNNVMCITPNGIGMASCYTAVDHDFGPKRNLTGGSAPGERNVIGPTFLNGVEISHGWDPSGVDTTDKWQNNENEVIGNWVGFRADGTYNASFRSGQNNPGTADNGNGINVYDGSNLNLVEGNWVASVWDGIQTMSPNATGNVIRGNVVGESPMGEPAPMSRDGIVVRNNSRSDIVEDNIVKNAGRYGIGLTQKDVLWIRLSGNIVTDMSGKAIHLEPDPANPTTGANNLQPAPAITLATTTTVEGTGEPDATVEIYQASRLAGQSGLPISYLGATLVAPDGTWNIAVNQAVGDRVTALQIATSNNTSELSVNVAVVDGAPVDPPVADFDWAQQAGTMVVQFTDTSTGSPASWQWDFGDGATSTEQNPSHQYLTPNDYNVSLTATNAGGFTTASETITVTLPTTTFFVADTFERSVLNGWGTADTGGAYIVDTTAANYSVANGVGTMTIPAAGASRSARLDAVDKRDVDVQFRVASDKVLSGASLIVYAAVRRTGNNEYRPRLMLNANGTVSVNASVLINGAESSLGTPVVVAGLNQAAGAFIWVRAEVSGTSPTTIRVKAWANGQPEPGGWVFTTTNSQTQVQGPGAVAMRAYLNTGGSNAPVKLSFDDYTITPATIAPPTAYAADTFTRSVSAGWGFADIGGPYTLEGVPAEYNVAGGFGTITVPTSNASRSVRLDDVSQRDVDITFRVAVDKVPLGGSLYVYAAARRLNNNEYRPRIILNSNGTVSVSASVLVGGAESPLGSAVVVPGLTQAAGAFIWFRAQVVGASPTTVNVKAWADGQAEPSGWQFTATNSQAVLQAAGTLGLRTYLSSGATNAPITLSFDDYEVSAAP